MNAIYEKILQELNLIDTELSRLKEKNAKAAVFIDSAIEELEKLK